MMNRTMTEASDLYHRMAQMNVYPVPDGEAGVPLVDAAGLRIGSATDGALGGIGALLRYVS